MVNENRTNENNLNKTSDVTYCVTAMIDLLGFSSHLEVGAYDLRTTIGQQAIERLRILDNALLKMADERKNHSKYYPKGIHVQRLNDCIFISMDLDPFLKPSIGAPVKRGTSMKEVRDLFTEKNLNDEEAFNRAYVEKISKKVRSLTLFVGIVSRLFNYINKMENEFFFPGAKAVISTGFRKPFFINNGKKEDFFSANFSLSNAYIAESKLKGSSLYVDNYILQLLSVNKYANNLIRYSLFISNESTYDPLEIYDDILYLPEVYSIAQPEMVMLFRKKYFFRKIDPRPISFMQILQSINLYLRGKKNPKDEKLSKKLLSSISNGPSEKSFENKTRPESLLYKFSNDIENNISIIPDLIITGKSLIRKKNIKDLGLAGFAARYSKN